MTVPFSGPIRRPVEKRNNQGRVVQGWTTLYANDTANVLSAADLHPSYRSALVSSSLETLYASRVPTTATHGNPPLIASNRFAACHQTPTAMQRKRHGSSDGLRTANGEAGWR
ncbi:unnamed protein product [Fusarium venenatum]|uniref:Uncharacterized protein n=1 Tax=Fusarium venenatum TaxID=56646 RepID=A0A2L2T5L0_9HYPO|nr:uncharacterized protein FVRRES_13370 [Fusarium venenatum]CEI40991.1 unnamed protein product [Fusarium venenatum]